MGSKKQCPVGLTGFRHYCPDDPARHPSKEKLLSDLEMSVRIGITPLSQEQSELLQFLRTGQRPKWIETPKVESIPKSTQVQTPKPEPAPVITTEQKKAMDDLAKLRTGVPFTKSYVPQIDIKEPEPIAQPLTFEEEIIHAWKNDPNVRAEFVSLPSYQAFRNAKREGKAKIIGGAITR